MVGCGHWPMIHDSWNIFRIASLTITRNVTEHTDLSLCSRGDFIIIWMSIQREYSSEPLLPSRSYHHEYQTWTHISEITLIHIQFGLPECSDKVWVDKYSAYHQIPWCIWLNLGRDPFWNWWTIIGSGASCYLIDNTLVLPHSAVVISKCINWVVFEVSHTNWLFDDVLANVDS